jgi:hypothetical protein
MATDDDANQTCCARDPLCAATWLPRRLARAAPNWMFCVRSLPQPNGPANALDLPVSAHTRRDGPGRRSTRAISGCGDPVSHEDRASRPVQDALPRVPGSGRCADPRCQTRRQRRSCSSAAGRLRSDAAGTSPSAISLAEHRVEFGVGPDLPDLLRAAAGDGDLGSPLQRLLA